MTEYRSRWRDEITDALGELARDFFVQEVAPHRERFECQQFVDPAVWTRAGSLGLLCCSIPREYGGGGGEFIHDLAVTEAQFGSADCGGFGNMVHSGIVAHYLLAYGTETQKARWLPRMASGELIGAIAMTEPSAGSDLQALQMRAERRGDEYVLTGSKTFITNGSQAGLVVVVAKTDPAARGRGLSLICVETERCDGFVRGRNLHKIGQHAADTSELFFDEVTVPTEFLLGGRPNEGFGQLMAQLPQERLLIGMAAVATMTAALGEAVSYARERRAFGQSLVEFQNTRFVLAEAATKVHTARVFLDSCIERHAVGELDAATAAMCKWWLTDLQCDVVDRCLQIFGGYGYMSEYPIARMYADARVQKIYGGTNEVMKEIIAKSLLSQT